MSQTRKLTSKSRIQLRKNLEQYTLAELKALCFDLEVEYEDLAGQGKSEKVVDLVTFLEGHDRIPELVEKGRVLYPNLDWRLEYEPPPPPPPPPSPPPPPRRFLLRYAVVAVIIVAAIVLGILLTRSCGSPPPTPTPAPSPTVAPTAPPTRVPPTPSPSARITNLTNGAQAAQYTTVLGEYRNLADELWLFVCAPNGRCYPQSMAACKGEPTPMQDGQWEMRVNLGDPGIAGQPITLVLTTANLEATRFIAGEIQKSCQDKFYPGFAQFPPGIKELDRITVIHSGKVWGQAPSISNAVLPGNVSLTNVVEGGEINQETTLSGTYTPDTTNDIWVLVSPYYGRWYPQSNDPCTGKHTTQANEQWKVRGVFGDVQDKRKPFEIAVVVASVQASKFFNDKQVEWCKANSHPGLLTIQLPKGIMEKSRVRVIRAPMRKTLFTMDDLAGWNIYNTGKSSASIVTTTGMAGQALAISYTLGANEWVGISNRITPGAISGTEEIGFSYQGSGAPNTVELKLIYDAGTVFGILSPPTATVTSGWTLFEVPYSKFACWRDTPGCLTGEEKLDLDKVTIVDIAISNKPGSTPGHGRIVIDELHANW